MCTSILHARCRADRRSFTSRPCDRFVYQLIEFEKELAQPYRFSMPQLSAVIATAALAGALVGKKLM